MTTDKTAEYGVKIFAPYSKLRGDIILLIFKSILCSISSIMIFSLIFKGFNIQCDYGLMYRIIFISVVILSILQINTIVYGIGCCFAVFGIFKYISSNTEVLKNGIKAIINQCYGIVSATLNLPQTNGFDNIIGDLNSIVNSVMIIIAIVISLIMVTIFIKFNSKILYGVFIGLIFALLSFFNCDISYFNSLIVVFSFGILCILNLSKGKSFSLNILKKNKTKIDFNYAYQLIIYGLVVFVFVFFITGVFYTNEKFEHKFDTQYSDNIKFTARDIAVMKYAEYKKFSSIDNVDLGQLSYSSYVKPNFKSNVFSFVTKPITSGRLYFANFIGGDYQYRLNNWTKSTDDNSVMINALEKSGAKAKDYEVRCGSDACFYPAYSKYSEYKYNEKNKVNITAYDYKKVSINDENYNNFVNENYLNIPSENKAVIEEICKKQGFSSTDNNIDEKLKEYFKNNFQYSAENDILPYGKDFVNYFLEESKKGNFIQYSSALTLIYRNLGIPARYVSGYAVDAEQTLAGNNAGGGRTNTAVKKGNLYSWVEVYNKDTGWRIVDLSISPSFKELSEKYDNSENSYTPNTSIKNYFRTVDKQKYSPKNIAFAGLNIVLKLLVWTLIVLVIAISLTLLSVYVYKRVVYAKSDNAKKAYILMEILNKKYKINALSYRDMIKKLSEKYGNDKAVEIVNLAERCIFANNVTDDDIKKLERLIKL